MKRLLFLIAVFAGSIFAQTNTCQFSFNFTQATGFTSQPQPNGFDNRLRGCNAFTVNYQATGLSALNVTLQSAGGAGSAGSWGSYSGTTVTGSNPLTNTSGAQGTFSGYVGWLRILISGTPTGSTWQVSGTVYGAQTGGAGTTSGAACPTSGASSCFVQGAVATGAAVAGFPVLIGGKDGSGNAEPIATDTLGGVAPASVSSANAAGISNTQFQKIDAAGNKLYERPMPYKYNGSTWDPDFVCPNSATISYSASSGTVQLIALTSNQIIRICHISFSSDTSTDITLVYGTGSNCGTGTTSLSGVYKAVTAMALDFAGTLRAAVSNAFCITSSASATLGGTVTYAKF